MDTMVSFPDSMLRNRVDVVVVGCGGSGSAIASGLPYLHQALVAWGHPGLRVTLIDGDRVSETNCVRQAFSVSEVGQHKAVVLASRTNLFWGFDWDAIPRPLSETDELRCDLVIGCVDTAQARRVIYEAAKRSRRVMYWLDLGNHATGGQFVLGTIPGRDGRSSGRLANALDLFPEICDPKQDRPDEPSCSAVESLTRQEPFINQVLAMNALALLTRLFRHGKQEHHGGFVDMAAGRCTPMPADRKQWTRIGKAKKRSQ